MYLFYVFNINNINTQICIYFIRSDEIVFFKVLVLVNNNNNTDVNVVSHPHKT